MTLAAIRSLSFFIVASLNSTLNILWRNNQHFFKVNLTLSNLNLKVLNSFGFIDLILTFKNHTDNTIELLQLANCRLIFPSPVELRDIIENLKFIWNFNILNLVNIFLIVLINALINLKCLNINLRVYIL